MWTLCNADWVSTARACRVMATVPWLMLHCSIPACWLPVWYHQQMQSLTIAHLLSRLVEMIGQNIMLRIGSITLHSGFHMITKPAMRTAIDCIRSPRSMQVCHINVSTALAGSGSMPDFCAFCFVLWQVTLCEQISSGWGLMSDQKKCSSHCMSKSHLAEISCLAKQNAHQLFPGLGLTLGNRNVHGATGPSVVSALQMLRFCFHEKSVYDWQFIPCARCGSCACQI